MKSKIAIFTIGILWFYQPAQAITLIGWDIPTSSSVPVPAAATVLTGMSVATGVTDGNFTMGTGLTSSVQSSSWRATSYNQYSTISGLTESAALAAANTNGDFWAFQFGASSGYSVTVNGIGSGTWTISNAGPTRMSMVYSTTSDFASYSIIETAAAVAGGSVNFASSFTTALALTPITIAENATGYFRLVGYWGTSTGGNGGLLGNLTAPDFSILGTSTSLALLNWTGGAGAWANGVAANWQNAAGTSTAWEAGKDGTIGNGGTLAVDAGGVTAGVVTVSGATEATFTGGAVSAGSLAMTAGSTLNLNNVNSAVSGAIDLTDATLTGGVVSSAGGISATVSTGSKTISTTLSGASGLTKSGAGELILFGANSYAGQTGVAAGTLTTSAADMLSDTATLKIDNLATFKLGGNETVGNINAAFGSTNTLQSFTLTSGGNNLSATNGALTTGTGGLIKNGTGQMYMNNSSNTYSGGFTLNNGEVVYTSSGTVTAGAIVGSVLGTGTLTWNGGVIASSSTNSSKTIYNNVVLNGRVQSGLSSWSNTTARLNPSTNTLGVITSYNSMLAVSTNAGSATTLAADSTINTLGWTMWEQNISGNYRITKDGTGASSLSNNFLNLRGSNNIAGVTLSSGILGYANRYALGTGTLILADGVVVGQSDTINNTATADTIADRTVANNISILGNVQFGLGVLQGLFSGNVDLSGATRTLTLGNTTTFFGAITNGGLLVQRIDTDLATNKSLYLYGANTYSGGTTVIGVADRTNNVQLGLGNNSALGTGSLTFSGGGTNTLRGITLSTADQNRTITNNIAINSGVSVSVDTITSLVTFDTGAAVTNNVSVNVALNGVISGAGALIKSGNNTVTLRGANSYSGATAVVDGALVVITNNISANITSNTIAITFSNTPANGTYAVLPGSLTGAYTATYTNLSSSQKATFSTVSPASVNVATKSIQLITGLASTDSKTVGDLDYSLTVAKGASSSSLTFGSDNTSVATVSSAGLVKIVGAGSTIIKINQSGDADYLAATEVTQTLTVNPAGSTFEDAYPGKIMTDFAPNGLTWLANYAFGGNATTQATLPVQDTSDPTKLRLVVVFRTDDSTLPLNALGGEATTDLAGGWSASEVSVGDSTDLSPVPANTVRKVISVDVVSSDSKRFLRATITK